MGVHIIIYKDKGLKKNKYGPTSVTIGNSVTKLVDTVYYTFRHILQYQPTFTILRHVQQKRDFEFYGQEPS